MFSAGNLLNPFSLALLEGRPLQKLKQRNVSTDGDKTKERLKADFNAATTAVKRGIVELSGQTRNSFNRTFDKGTANARIILAMAEGLQISPYYYTGELDERAPLQDADIISFLESHGYTDLAAELKTETPTQKPKRKYTRKPKAEPAPDSEVIAEEPAPEAPEPEAPAESAAETAADTIDVKITLPNNPQVLNAVNSLTEEQAIALLKALLIKEKAGGDSAKMAEIIKRCLLI